MWMRIMAFENSALSLQEYKCLKIKQIFYNIILFTEFFLQN